jgi:hypothetical protein
LDLNLLCYKGLKWLITLGLMILNGRVAETSDLAAASAGNELAACLQALVHVAIVIDRRRGSIMAQINGAHTGPVHVGIQSPCFKIVVRWLAGATWIGLFQQHIERKKRARLAAVHAQTLARLGPKRGRVVHVVCIRACVGRPAESAGIKLMHARVAFAPLAGLAVHLAANSASLIFCQPAARRIHAHPEAGKSAKKIMDTARQEPRAFGVNPRHASQSHEYRHSAIGLGGCVGE